MNISDIYIDSHTPHLGSNRPHLLLVHGSWGGGWMWKKYILYLTERGWNVHAIDLRGHGKSGGSVAGAIMEDYEADVRTAVERLGLTSPVVVGHSMGGLISLMYARDYDVSALVALGPSPSLEGLDNPQEKEYKEEYTPMDAGMPANLEEAMKNLHDLSKEMLMDMKEMLGVESGTARSERKKGVSVPSESISVPTLFVGSSDGGSVAFGIGIKSTRRMAEVYDADLIEIKDATHPGLLMGEHAQEAVSVVETWLSDNL